MIITINKQLFDHEACHHLPRHPHLFLILHEHVYFSSYLKMELTSLFRLLLMQRLLFLYQIMGMFNYIILFIFMKVSLGT